MYAQQKLYASNKKLTSVASTMIQGAAFDQIVKFVNYPGTDLVSRELGEVYQTGGLNYTGAIAYNDILKNIFDLDGNVTEATTYVTQQASIGSSTGFITRGPDYSYSR